MGSAAPRGSRRGPEPSDCSRAARPDQRAEPAHRHHGPPVEDTDAGDDPWRRHPSVERDPADQAPGHAPAMYRVEDTVLDLIQIAPTFDDAYEWICRAVGRRRTTSDRICQAMGVRKKMRWRRELALALGDAGDGVLSVLEYRYVHRVERPHGLPVARRQVRIRQRTGNKYLDNLYEEYGVCVELDGTAAHPEDEQWRDKRRDNANLSGGIVTFRFGFPELGERRCESATYVAAALRERGWAGTLRPCNHTSCPIAGATS